MYSRYIWRPGEAEGFFKRALEMREAKMAPDKNNRSVFSTLHGLMQLARETEISGEGDVFYKLAADILEEKMGPANLSVVHILHGLG